MKTVKSLTQFLAAMASRNESTEHGLYALAMSHPELKKLDALDPETEQKVKKAITVFVEESFESLIKDICAQYAVLLLDIKNQKDSFELANTPPDIVGLEKVAAEQAEKFKILVEVVRRAIADVDWDYVAERIIAAGKKQNKTKPFSDN